MKKQKMRLANIQGKLNRGEMKNIMGGDAPIPGEGGCPGIIACPTLEVGDNCGGMGPDCTCKLGTDEKQWCMP